MPLADPHKERLREIARASIEYGLARGEPLPIDTAREPKPLSAPGASFVTLTRHGRLRGCIGSLEAQRPLAVDVSQNAFAAAFEDPRFEPLTPYEVEDLDINISVLSPPERLEVRSEEDLLRTIRPGIDGLILQRGARRATFLPSVWEDLPEPREFIRHLKMKGGWPPHVWYPDFECWRYETEYF